MNQAVNRRKFLTAGTAVAAAGATGLAFAGSAGAKTNRASALAESAEDAPFKISLAQWSLHRTLRSGKISNLDFPAVTKKEFGISGVEYVNQFFKDKAEDTKYLDELNQRCGDNGVESVLVMVDGEGALGDANEEKRIKAVENHYRWVTAAKHLGCHAIRVNAQSSGGFQQQVKLAADGLRRLSVFAKQYGINVLVENHGGLSSNGQWLAQVMRTVGLPNCGTLPDFGNFRIGKGKDGKQRMYDRYLGMASLMPFAKAVSAKSHDFDEDGNETATNFQRVMRIVQDSGYRGWVGVEYEGGKLDEYAGIKATKALLEKCIAKLPKRS
jgi:sugar phosphate isomerase/epimerase